MRRWSLLLRVFLSEYLHLRPEVSGKGAESPSENLVSRMTGLWPMLYVLTNTNLYPSQTPQPESRRYDKNISELVRNFLRP